MPVPTTKDISSRLGIFYFVYFLVIGSFMPFWNAFLEQSGYSKVVIGLLGTIPVLTRIIAPGLWGHLADKTQQRMRLVRIAAVMQLASWLLLTQVIHQLPLLVAILFVFSFFQNAILSQFEAVALYWLNYQPAQYGRIRLWGSLGFIAAATGLGFWFNAHSLLTFPVWMIIFTLLALVLAFIVPNPPRQPADHPQQTMGRVLKQPAVILFFLLEFLLLFSHAPFYTFYTNYLQQYHYAPATTGLLWGAGVLAEVLMFLYNAPLLRRFSLQNLLTACLAVTALRWSLVGLFPAQVAVQFFAQGLHAFSFGLFQMVAMQVLRLYFTPAQQGRAQGLFSMTWGLAVGVGGLLSGQLWDVTGGPGVYLLAAGVCLGATGLAMAAFRKVPLEPLRLPDSPARDAGLTPETAVKAPVAGANRVQAASSTRLPKKPLQ